MVAALRIVLTEAERVVLDMIDRLDRKPLQVYLATVIGELRLTDDKESTAKIPESFSRVSLRRKKVDVLRAESELGTIDNDFIFETVWFGHSSFVVDSATRSEQLIERFLELLTKRKETRAKVRQSVHVVWDLKTPMPEAQKQKFALLAKATGFSLIINS